MSTRPSWHLYVSGTAEKNSTAGEFIRIANFAAAKSPFANIWIQLTACRLDVSFIPEDYFLSLYIVRGALPC